MNKTIVLEDLPIDAQRAIEELFASRGPVLLSRHGHTVAGVIPIHPNELFPEIGPQERTSILDSIEQGERDYASGLGITLDNFKNAYADRLNS